MWTPRLFNIEANILRILTNASDKINQASNIILKSPLFEIKTTENWSSQIVISESIYLFNSVFWRLEDGDPDKENFVCNSLPQILQSLIENLKSPDLDSLIASPWLNSIKLILSHIVEWGKYEMIEYFKNSNGEEIVSNFVTDPNFEVRDLASEILNEHFRYDIDIPFVDDAEIEYEGNLYW